MDYHVFLLSRIRERYDQTGNNAEAVAYGLRSTGGLITGAALIPGLPNGRGVRRFRNLGRPSSTSRSGSGLP